MDLATILILTLATLWLILLFASRLRKRQRGSISTLIVLGSGGHTAEMVKLVSSLDRCRYSPRHYVAAVTDALSAEKARTSDPDGHVYTVPRAREVGQSWASSAITTLRASISSWLLVWRIRPDLVLCNGPGTCVPISMAAWLLRKLLLTKTKIVFVESVCRVQKLSLSGKILAPLADETLVQWPELTKEKHCKYVARFV